MVGLAHMLSRRNALMVLDLELCIGGRFYRHCGFWASFINMFQVFLFSNETEPLFLFYEWYYGRRLGMVIYCNILSLLLFFDALFPRLYVSFVVWVLQILILLMYSIFYV